MVLVQVQYFETATRDGLEILHQCGKKVKTKCQTVLGANIYVSRGYRGKTGTWAFLHPLLLCPILNRANFDAGMLEIYLRITNSNDHRMVLNCK